MSGPMFVVADTPLSSCFAAAWRCCLAGWACLL